MHRYRILALLTAALLTGAASCDGSAQPAPTSTDRRPGTGHPGGGPGDTGPGGGPPGPAGSTTPGPR